MIKIVAFLLCCAVLASLLHTYQNVLVIPFVVCAGCIVFLFVFEMLEDTVFQLESISERVGIHSAYIKMLLKVIGISYLCEFASSVCRDSGNASLAMKIDLSAKLLILSQSLPIFTDLLKIIQDIFPF